MGAGVAAVAGIENGPSSSCTTIEEAQAELRQELAGRNERRRELEFLEKGGDPLEFKLVEGSAGLWSFSQTDSFGKNLLSSDGNLSYSLTNFTREDKLEFSPEDGLEFKRARSSTGKFFVDRCATTINPIASTLPNSISSSLDHDKRKVPDICKNNKTAVKGQYARRNRQRSNRFGNGCAVVLDSGKLEVEGGSSNYSSGIRDPLLHDAKLKDAIKEEQMLVSTQDISFQSNDLTVIGCPKDTEAVTIDIENSTEATQSLLKRDAVNVDEQNKDLQIITQLHSNESTGNTVLELPVEERARTSLSCSAEAKISGGHELESTILLSVEEEKQVCSEPMKEIENNVQTESPKKLCVQVGSQIAEYGGNSNRNDQVTNGLINSDMILQPGWNVTAPLSEGNQNLDAKVNPIGVSLEPVCVSSILGDITAATCSSSDNKVNNDGLPGKVLEVECVKIKVEETSVCVASPSTARLSDQKLVDMEMPLEAHNHHPKCSEGGHVSSGNAIAEDPQVNSSAFLPERAPAITSIQEKREASALSDNMREVHDTLFSVKEKSVNEEDEKSKASLQQCTDLMKPKVIQEPPWKKSHWDFVLEEMAWLANDFMQERLWKVAAAAQVARWVMKERHQSEFEKAESQKQQQQIARSLAKKITSFWHSSEALLRDVVRNDNVSMPVLSSSNSEKTATDKVEVVPISAVRKALINKTLPVHKYAIRFLKNATDQQALSQAEAPPTPDRVFESGLFDFWDEKLPEESLLYMVPNHAMELYCQSVVSQWEMEYEQRLQEHESMLTEAEVHAAGDAVEYTTGNYGGGSFISSVVTGKRNSGLHGSIPIKRMRTSAVAARQRAAGAAGPLVSGSAAHLGRSDISSGDTTSQQDEITTIIEGSSVSGRVTDAESTGAFMRSNMTADGVDSPLKIKKKKKSRPVTVGHSASTSYDARESETPWQHIAHEPKEHLKHRGEQSTGSAGLEGLGTFHGAGIVTNTSKLIKHIHSRDRSKKYKASKASITQPGCGVPWSSIEDQAILGLVYELGSNWELVSDILSSNSQLKGIFRKPKDCKERHIFLTERLGGDDGDSPDDPSSSSHLPISLGQKGGTRFLPQHLEETLKTHVDCILQLHQRIRNKRQQNETQEKKQLVPEHESHALKLAVPLTPLELCEQAAECGAHPCSLQSSGFGMANMMSGTGLRPNSSIMSVLQGSNNLQLSSSVPPPAISTAMSRDAQRMGPLMRPLTTEEHRIRYNRMVAGRGMQSQCISGPAGILPFMGLPNSVDSGGTPATLSPGNNANFVGGLNKGVPLPRNNFPGMGPIGAQNNTASMNNVLPSVGMNLPGAGTAISSSANTMRRPARDAMAMAPTQSTTLNSSNNSVVSSPINLAQSPQQQQLIQHSAFQAQQHSPSSSQQPSYSMNMRAGKDRQQLLQQDSQKRMQQQQLSPTASSSSQSMFPSSSQTFITASQSQHIHPSPHGHMFPQPSHLLMQSHGLPQDSGTQQITATGSVTSPTVPTFLSSGQSNGQQQAVSPAQVPLQTKQSLSKQQQQHLQGKGMKGMGRGSATQGHLNSQPHVLQGQQMVQSQQLCGQAQPSVQNLTALPQVVPDTLVQQYQQKNFGKQIPTAQASSVYTCSTSTSTTTTTTTTTIIQPTSPSAALASPPPQQAPAKAPSLSLTQQQQRRMNQSSQTQQRRPQQGQAANAQQVAKNGVQLRPSVSSQFSAVSQLSNSTNSSPLVSNSTASGSVSMPSPQLKSGQHFSSMSGLYNLSRGNNNGAAAQVPMAPSSNGNGGVTTNTSQVSQEGRNAIQNTNGQKPSSVIASQLMEPSQRLSPQQAPQSSCLPNSPGGAPQVRPPSSGTMPVPPE